MKKQLCGLRRCLGNRGRWPGDPLRTIWSMRVGKGEGSADGSVCERQLRCQSSIGQAAHAETDHGQAQSPGRVQDAHH